MGRPINKRFFGTSAEDAEIKVQFNDGTGSVDGWIVKQLAARRFRCTDGAKTGDCRLVDKLAGALLEGEMSISVKDDAGVVKQVTKISGRKVTVDTGESIKWNFSDSTTDGAVEMEEAGGGYGEVESVVGATPGTVYEIVEPGDTDFTIAAIGAGDSNIGTQFTMGAGPGVGTGTVKEVIAEDTFGL